jgi:hypothetical protein
MINYYHNKIIKLIFLIILVMRILQNLILKQMIIRFKIIVVIKIIYGIIKF